MNRFQITADVDATVWLGVLEDFQYAPMNIDYEKLKEFFELGATIDLDGEGLVPVTWGLELTSADKN